MSTFENNMSDIFNIPNVVTENEVVVITKDEIEEVDKPLAKQIVSNAGAKKDYEYARDNLHDMINHAKSALDELQTIASVTESPRAFEVYATLVKTTVDANRELMELHRTMKKLTEDEAPAQNITNNSLFVGSTNELMKLIKNNQE
jgi:K+/H+ antiporter YhaU regulatory subunit KhtT